MNCPVCWDNLYHLFDKEEVSYMKCNKCGLVKQHPEPMFEKLKAKYDENNKYFVNENKGVDYVKGEAWLRETARFYISILSRWVPSYNVEMLDILDFGCGTGILCHEFQKDGHTALGIELSEWAAKFGKKKYGVNIIQGDLFQVDLQKIRFDIVTMMHTIEHLQNPIRYVEKLTKSLKENGIMMIATPNVDCITSRFFGKNWRYYLPNEHIYLFNEKSLKILLGKIGLNSIVCEYLLYRDVNYLKSCLGLGILFVKKMLSIFPISISFYKIQNRKWRNEGISLVSERDGLIVMAKKSGSWGNL